MTLLYLNKVGIRPTASMPTLTRDFVKKTFGAPALEQGILSGYSCFVNYTFMLKFLVSGYLFSCTVTEILLMVKEFMERF